MIPEWTVVAIYLVVIFAVDIFEWVGIFESGWVGLEVYFTVPCHFFMVFNFIWSVVFLAFGPMCMACKCNVASLPAIFTLEDF